MGAQAGDGHQSPEIFLVTWSIAFEFVGPALKHFSTEVHELIFERQRS